MVKSGALRQMTQSFIILTQGVAAFIKDLGPGMKGGAALLVGTAKVIRFVLEALGVTLGTLGAVMQRVLTGMRTGWDAFRHWMSNTFDTWRHGWAHDWDSLWNDSIGTLVRWKASSERLVIGWIANVVTWFGKMPGQVGRALSSFGSTLKNIGTTAMHEFLSGLQSIGGSILSWIKNFFTGIPHAILSFFHMSPPHAGSVFFDLGANLMHHLEAGIQSRARSVRSAAAGAIGKFGIAPSGPVQAYARKLLAAYGWGSQWGAFNDIVMRESGWNPRAQNPSGAYGIPQALPASKMASAGADWRTDPYTQLRWMMAYIRSRWGSPANADANEIRNHWYGKGLHGGIFTRPTLIGVGEAGAERVDVTPLGHGPAMTRSGALVNVQGDLVVQDANDAALVSRRLAFMVTSATLGGG
jgi:hypothetical protein